MKVTRSGEAYQEPQVPAVQDCDPAHHSLADWIREIG